MQHFKSPASLRAFYVIAASVIWLGIWHTGFVEASWILYVPASMFILAAVTGFCPSLILARLALERKGPSCVTQ